MSRALTTLVLVFLTTHNAMAIDLTPLWDFSKPEVSEQRFRTALETAKGDDALILHTQIARTHGLRKDFAKAQALLAAIEPQIKAAGHEARARYALELGRTYASATHPRETQTDEAKARARTAFTEALAIAKSAKSGELDALAIDAIHMFAFIDTAPADQLKWAQEALIVSVASNQPAARRWEGSIRNNLGMALHGLGRFDDALAQFKQALAIREQGSDLGRIRVAHWMVAWTLRAMNRLDESLEIQLRLEKECAAANEPDPYVFEELETLYRSKGNEERASHYSALRKPMVK
jgi:tetratricopeptide (TPR) repeat protein